MLIFLILATLKILVVESNNTYSTMFKALSSSITPEELLIFSIFTFLKHFYQSFNSPLTSKFIDDTLIFLKELSSISIILPGILISLSLIKLSLLSTVIITIESISS